MSEQPEALRLAEMTPSLRGGDWGDRAATELRRLHAEADRLRAGLTKANSQAEHFEREWYLRGDEVERLQAARMTDIDIADDDALRFVQRVLETNAPEAYRLDARAKVSAIRTRVLKARATSQPAPVWSPAYTRGPAKQSAPVAAAHALVPLSPAEVSEVCSGIFLSDHPQGSSSYDQALADALTAALARINGLTVGDGGAKS